jgi:hypothetical protein
MTVTTLSGSTSRALPIRSRVGEPRAGGNPDMTPRAVGIHLHERQADVVRKIKSDRGATRENSVIYQGLSLFLMGSGIAAAGCRTAVGVFVGRCSIRTLSATRSANARLAT